MYFSETTELPAATRTDAGTFFFPNGSFSKEADLYYVCFPEKDKMQQGWARGR